MSTGVERRKDLLDFGIKVGVLENNVEILTKVCTKMDGTLEKTQEIASNLAKIVAVHEERFDYQEKNFDSHKTDDDGKFEKLTKLVERNNTSLGDKIDGIQRQLEPIKKFVWMAMGIVAVLMVVMEAVSFFLK